MNDIFEEAAKYTEDFIERAFNEALQVVDDGAIFVSDLLRADNNRNEANKYPRIRKGDYAKSWTVRKPTAKAKETRAVDFIVHNKKYYRLTHLLEKGAIRAKTGVIKGDGHIARAWEQAVKHVEKNLGG